MISDREMAEKLIGCPEGTIVFGSYLAGRKPKLRAKLEAMKAEYEGYNRKYFYGELVRLFTNKDGEYVFTVYSHCRYNIKNLKDEGNYRAYNPSIGKLLSLEIIGKGAINQTINNFWCCPYYPPKE